MTTDADVLDKPFIRLVADFYMDDKMLSVGKEVAYTYLQLLGVAKAYYTDGKITRGQLMCAEPDHPDEHADKMVKAGLLSVDGDKWKITAWHKHNRSIAEIKSQRSQAGKRSAEIRRLRKLESVELEQESTTVNDENSISASVLCSSSTTQTTEAVKNSSTAKRRVLDADSGYEPDDPQYDFDPTYDGSEHLAYWREHGGKIQRPHESAVQASFMRMHNSFRRSKQEISALVAFVCSDADAKQWWLVGKTPADWCDEYKTDTGKQEPKWTRIRAAWLRKGGALPTVSRVSEKAPPPDPNCDCRRGWLEDDQGQEYPCPKCLLGKHLLKGGAN